MQSIPPTGHDDAPALSAACAGRGVVTLDGAYRLGAPFVSRARIVCSPGTTMLYRGKVTTGPAITLQGNGAAIEGLTLNCQKRSAGIMCDGAWYTDDLLRRVRIENATRCGLRLARCWNGNIRDVRIVWCDGVALWATQHNSARLENIQVAHCTLADDTWPTDLPELERAAIVVTDSNVTEFDNLLCEPVNAAPYPSVYLRSCTSSLHNVRFEAGRHGFSHIAVDGDGWWTGSHITIDQVVIAGTGQPAECLVDVRGKARDIIVRQVMASKYLKRIANNPNNNPGVEVSHCTPAA